MALRSVVEEREPAYASTGNPRTAPILKTPARYHPGLSPATSSNAAAAALATPSLGVLVASWPPPLRLALALTEGGWHDDLRIDLVSHGIGWLTLAWRPVAATV